MGQDEHCHDHVFGNRNFVAEDVTDRDTFRDRRGVQEVKTSRHGLQQAKARRGRESSPPDMTDYDLRLGERRGNMRRV